MKRHTRWLSALGLGVLLVALTTVLWNTVLSQVGRYTPERALHEARGRLDAAGSYRLRGDLTQTLYPRGVVGMVGHQERRRALRIDGAVQLPTTSHVELISRDDPAQPPLTISSRDGQSLVLQNGTAVPTPASFPLPVASVGLLSYLDAAVDIRREPGDPAQPMLAHYSFRIDGTRYAANLHARGLQAPVASLRQLDGRGELWLDAQGLPLRQVLDLGQPQISDAYDAQLQIDIEFYDIGQVSALPQPIQNDDGSWRLVMLASSGTPPDASRFWTARDLLPPSWLLRLGYIVLGIATGSLFLRLLFLLACRYLRRSYTITALLVSSLLIVELSLPPGDVGGLRAKAVQAAEQQRTAQEIEQNVAAVVQQQTQPQPGFTSGNNDAGIICGDGERTVDSDGDTLSDFAENCIGTDAEDADSDRDGIFDNDEINGISWQGKSWTSDPLQADSNRDGLVDTIEWPEPYGTGVLTDTNGNGVPDFWDDDNDGDGVPDTNDLSPVGVTPLDSTFELMLNGSQTFDGATYVEFQLRPEDPNHLRYTTTALDWPNKDNQGQITDLDDSKQDIRLIPMLEIETNRTTSLASTYNVVLVPGTAAGTHKFYAPLQIVTTNGAISAFHAKWAYAGDEANGARLKLRLVWFVQAIYDQYINCPNSSPPTKNCLQSDPQLVQTYAESFRVTGLEVTRSRQVDSVIFGTPTTPNDDSDLNRLLEGLDTTFLAAQALSDTLSPERDMLDEISYRFSQPNTPPELKWDITRPVVSDRQGYSHIDAALLDMSTRRVTTLLNDPRYRNAAPAAQCRMADQSRQPCAALAFAMEQQLASYNIDDEPRFNRLAPLQVGARLEPQQIDLDGEEFIFETLRSLQLNMYTLRGGAWQKLDQAEVLGIVERRYDWETLAREQQVAFPGITADDLRFWAFASYLNWVGGKVSTMKLGAVDLRPLLTGMLEGLNARLNDLRLLLAWRIPSGVHNIFQGRLGIVTAADAKGFKIGNISKVKGYFSFSVGAIAALVIALQIARVACAAAQCDEQAQLALQATTQGLSVILRAAAAINEGLGVYLVYTRAVGAVQKSKESSLLLKLIPPAQWKQFSNIYTKSPLFTSQAKLTPNETTKLAKLKTTSRVFKALAVVGLLVDLSLAATIFTLSYQAATTSYDRNTAIANFGAAVTLSLTLFLLAFIPGAGVVLAVVLLLAIIAELIGEYAFGVNTSALSRVTQAIATFFYDYKLKTQLENIEFIGTDHLRLADSEAGFVAGNTIIFADRFRSTFTLNDGDGRETWGRGFLVGDASKLPLQVFPNGEVGDLSPRVWANADWPVCSTHNGRRSCTNEARIRVNPSVAQRDLALTIKWWLGYMYEYRDCVLLGLKCENGREYETYPATGADDINQPQPADKLEQYSTIVLDVLPSNLDELWEGQQYLGLINPDPDGDGLTTAEEQLQQTNPNAWDSDQDGLGDGYEVRSRSNANLPDSDFDRVSDDAETRFGSRPAFRDSDNDLLDDGYEMPRLSNGELAGGWLVPIPGAGTVRVFSNPNLADSDGDGLSDLTEFENRLSPYAFNDAPRLALDVSPVAVSPAGRVGSFLQPGQPLTVSLQLLGVGAYPVSSTLALCLPPVLVNLNGGMLQRSGGSASSLLAPSQVNSEPCGTRYSWNLAGGQQLLQGEILSATFRAMVTTSALSIEVSGEQPLLASVPYAGTQLTATTAIIIDWTNPGLRLTDPADGTMLRGQRYVVGGTSSDEYSWVTAVTVELPGTTRVLTENLDQWATSWDLPADGSYTIRARAHDYVGRSSPEASTRVIVDNTPPSATLAVTDNAILTASDPATGVLTITGNAGDNLSGVARLQISIDGRPWQEIELPDGDRRQLTWHYAWAISSAAQGAHRLSVRAYDKAGNLSSQVTRNVVVDAVAPANSLTTQSFQAAEPPYVKAGQALPLAGYVNDAGNVPLPPRPATLLGELSSVATATVWLELPSVNDSLSMTVSWLGDINGDALADLAVGMPNANSGAGRISIVYGRGGDWPATPDLESIGDSPSSFIGAPNARLGSTIAPAGDLNGDGLFDLLIGDPANSRAFVLFGRPQPWGSNLLLDGQESANWLLLQAPQGLKIGNRQAAAGNFNGDSFDDLLIGATPTAGSAPGKLYLVPGRRNAAWPRSATVEQLAAAQLPFPAGGAHALGIGDTDGDQRDDFVLADPQNQLGGGAGLHLFVGSTSYALTADGVPRSLTLADRRALFAGALASQVSALGDVNGDELADFIYNAADGPRLVVGRSSGAWTDSLALTGYGPQLDGFLAAPGDVDRDGKNDILIGGTANGQPNAYLFLGTSSMTVTNTPRPPIAATFSGVAAAASAPYAAGADLNCDASSDLLLIPVGAATGAQLPPELSYGTLPPIAQDALPTARLGRVAAGLGGVLETNLAPPALPDGISIPPNLRFVDDDYCAGCANDGFAWGQNAFATISTAVANASDFTQIVVRPGVYAPFTVSDKSNLWISGVDPDAVFIDGQGSTNAAITLTRLQGGGLTNLSVINVATGVRLENVGAGSHRNPIWRITLDRLLIQHTGQHAVVMDRTSSLTLRRSTLVGSPASSEYIKVEGSVDPTFVSTWTAEPDLRQAASAGGPLAFNNHVYQTTGAGGQPDTRRVERLTLGEQWLLDVDTPALGLAAPLTGLAARDSDLFVGSSKNRADYQINAMALSDDGNLYVGGKFQLLGNPDGSTVAAQNVARWDGSRWHALGGGVDGEVLALTMGPNGSLYIGGAFLNALAANRTPVAGTRRIALWENGAWKPLGGGLPANVQSMAYQPSPTGGKLFISGPWSWTYNDLGTTNRTLTPRFAGWNEVTGRWMALVEDPPNWPGLPFTHMSTTANGQVFGAIQCRLYRLTADTLIRTTLVKNFGDNGQGGISFCQEGTAKIISALAADRRPDSDAVWVGFSGLDATQNNVVLWPDNSGFKLDERGDSSVFALAATPHALVVLGSHSGQLIMSQRYYFDGRRYVSRRLAQGAGQQYRALAANSTSEDNPLEIYLGGSFTRLAPTPGRPLSEDLSANGVVKVLHTLGRESWEAVGRGLIFNEGNIYVLANGLGTSPASSWRTLDTPPLANVAAIAGGYYLFSSQSFPTLYVTEQGSRRFFTFNTLLSNDYDNMLQRPDMPVIPGPGHALASVGPLDLYALGGGGSGFYRFNGSWSTLAALPFAVSTGAGLVYDGGDYLYASQGGNGNGFARYHISTNGWEQLPNLPFLAGAGGGLVRAESQSLTYIYAIAGGDSRKVWRYGPVNLPTPQKLRVEQSAFLAAPVAGASWISPTLLGNPPVDFGVVLNDNRFVQGSNSNTVWTPTPPAGTTIPFSDARFRNPVARNYRVDANSVLTATGYARPTTDVFVSPDYGPNAPNDSLRWGVTAFNSIQAAINSGAARVVLRPGIYQETFSLVSGVEVVGSGADTTIIQAPANSRAQAIVSAEGVSGVRLARLSLVGNQRSDGLSVERAQLTLARSIVRNTNAAVRLRDARSDLEIVNVTFANNRLGVDAANAPIDVRNSLFAFHTTAALSFTAAPTLTILHPYNAFWQNNANYRVDGTIREVPQAGAITSDPQLSDPRNANYRPMGGSPLLSAGAPNDPMPPGTSSRVDIGYLQQGRAALYVDDDYGPGRENDGLEWGVDAFTSIQAAIDTAQIEVKATVCGSAPANEPACPQVTIGVGPGIYTESVRLKSRIRLVGSGAEQTTIHGNGNQALDLSQVQYVEISGFNLRNGNPTQSVLRLNQGSRAVTITHNVIRDGNGILVWQGSAATIRFNTIVQNEYGIRVMNPGSSVSVENTIVANNRFGLWTSDAGTISGDYNLLRNGTNYSGAGVVRATNDIVGPDPGFVNPATADYRLTTMSPAVDAADFRVRPVVGGGERADIGYRELLAVPLALLFGKQGLSCTVGNAGVQAVDVGLVRVADAAQPISATLPGTWTPATLTTGGQVASYWQASPTPASDGLYRLFVRASDVAGNQIPHTDWYMGAVVADSLPPTTTWRVQPPASSTVAAVELVGQTADYADAGGVTPFSVAEVFFEIDGQRFAATWDDSGWNPALRMPRTFRSWVPLPAGTSLVRAIAVDKAGNEGRSPDAPITVSGTNIATIVSPVNNQATTALTLTLSGFARFAAGSTPSVRVLVNGTAVTATLNAPGQALSAWSTDLRLPDDGAYSLIVEAGQNGNFNPAGRHSITVIRDTQAPGLSVSAPGDGGFISSNITFRGSASDSGGVAAVELSVDNGCTWNTAILTGTQWTLDWTAPEGAAGQQYSFIVRARDQAGNSSILTRSLTIDTTPPQGLLPINFSTPPASYLDQGQSLTVTWTAATDNGTIPQVLVSIDSLSDTLAVQPVSGSSYSAQLNTAGEYYVQIAAVDSAGNRTQYTYGPWYVRSLQQQLVKVDGYLDRSGGEWDDTTMLLDDDERARPLRQPQQLYATWDDQSFYLGWQGAQWALDGMMVAYLGLGSGTTNLPLPLPATISGSLPFTASYAVVISTTADGTVVGNLFSAEAGGWAPSSANWRFAHSSVDGGTEISLPLGRQQVAGAPLRLIAIAREQNGNVWSAFPTTNPLNAPATTSYQWTSLGDPRLPISQPNAGQPRARMLRLQLISPQANIFQPPAGEIQLQLKVANDEAATGLTPTVQFSLTPSLLLLAVEGATCTTPVGCQLTNLRAGSTQTISATARIAPTLQQLHTLTATVQLSLTNASINGADIASVGIPVDGEAPGLQITTDTTPTLRPGRQRLIGVASDGAGVGTRTVRVRPAGATSWLTADGGNPWSIDLDIPASSPFVVEAQAADQLGNTSPITRAAFVVDTVPPTATLELPTRLWGATTILSGTARDPFPINGQIAAVELQFQQETAPWIPAAIPATTTTGVIWSYSWQLPRLDNQTLQVRVRAGDNAGNLGAPGAWQTTTIDTIAPLLTTTVVVTRVVAGDYQPNQNSNRPVLAGEVSDGNPVLAMEVSQFDPAGVQTTIPVTPSGRSWHYVPLLAATPLTGTYRLQVVARDQSGNTTLSLPFNLQVDPTPLPTAPTPFHAVAHNGQVLLSWPGRQPRLADYLLERATNGGAFMPLATLPPTQTSYRDLVGDTVGLSFTYRLRGRLTNQQTGAAALVTVTPRPYRLNLPQDGIITLNSSEYSLQRSIDSLEWQPATSSASTTLTILPNRGTTIDSQIESRAPAVGYPVQFTLPGTYTVWAFMSGPGYTDDSIHVGLNDNVQPSADRLTATRLRTWHWSSRTMDGPAATLVVTQTGIQTVTVWMREDGIQLEKLLLVHSDKITGTIAPATFENGQAVLEAETAVERHSGSGWAWQITSLSGMQNNGVVQALPNAGGRYDTNLATKPRLVYPVQFTTPGTYTVWARIFAPASDSDSIHVGLNDNVQPSADRLTATRLRTWHWSSRTMDGPAATLVVTQTGIQTVTVWMREDGTILDTLILVATERPNKNTAPFLATNDQVVFEAEDAVDWQSAAGWSWSAATLSRTVGSGAVQALPNVGGNYDTNLATKPQLSYPVQFTTPGTYTLWARMLAPSGADDSIQFGLNGVVQSNDNRLVATRVNQWHWSRTTGGRLNATLVISQTGVHTVTVWMREDGILIDRLLLTRVGSYVPSGLGPAASPRKIADQ